VSKEFEYHADLGWANRINYAMSSRVRRRLFDLFMKEFRPTRDSRVADLGVTANRAEPVHYFFESWYPHTHNLTAIGREHADWYREAFPGITYVNADLRSIPFPDGYFDYGICNAVVEHAGARAAQAALIAEVCRVCRAVMVATPNGAFPVDPHTFLPVAHWLPERGYRAALRLCGFSEFADIEVLNPLMPGSFLELFPRSRQNRLVKIGLPLLRTNLVCISARRG
jgi:hypothetical protein